MHLPNKTATQFYNISLLLFFLGSPNFWIEDLNMPKIFTKTYRVVSKCLNLIIPLFIIFEIGAFITQDNLTKKQESDLLIYSISHPILWSYSMIIWNRDKDVKMLLSHILGLKRVYNDLNVEEAMLKKSNRDSAALVLTCILSMTLHTISAVMQILKSGTFTTVITIWPLVDDPSRAADITRTICNIIWWVFISRVVANYIIIISLTTTLSYQYLNLQSYFYGLADVFDDTKLSQSQKEREYEKTFIVGIKLHTSTIKCFNRFRNIFKGIFSGQIIFVILVLVSLMTQMMKSERTMVNASATALTATAVLISTGFFLWNAGDITLEASKLSTAMYLSGWHNCRKKGSSGIRKLVVIAMTYAQKPVVIKGLGIMPLSYQSYLSLVKTSYSVFSVIY